MAQFESVNEKILRSFGTRVEWRDASADASPPSVESDGSTIDDDSPTAYVFLDGTNPDSLYHVYGWLPGSENGPEAWAHEETFQAAATSTVHRVKDAGKFSRIAIEDVNGDSPSTVKIGYALTPNT